MSDCFTAPPNGMSYDDGNEPRRFNDDCKLCWRKFWRTADNVAGICDRCSDAADWRAQERKRMAKAELKPRVATQGQG